jgi:hypothetical protein
MNVQQTIINGIKEQLFYNDYLVLPGFGGFVLKNQAAHFSSSRGMLLPSGKLVSFNAQLKQNDGILAIWLQNNLNCKASEAINHLTDFAEFCTTVLSAKRRLTLNGIGFFYLDFENNICFEPQSDANFMRESFGLGSISIKELLIAEPEPIKKETLFTDRVIPSNTITEVKNTKRRKNYTQLIVPILLILVLFGVTSLLVINTKISGELKSSILGNDSHKNFSPLNYPDLKLILTTEKNKAYVADANGIALIELEEGKSIVVSINNDKVPDNTLSIKPSTKKITTNAGQYEIVLGCFTILGNANKMVANLADKNVAAFVSGINHKGMHVVSVGNFSTKNEALAKLTEIKSSFPHAWIKTP